MRVSVLIQKSDFLFAACHMCVVPIEKRDVLFIVCHKLCVCALCLIQKSDGASSKDFKKTKTRDSVAEVLKAFIADNQTVLVSISHTDTRRHNTLSQAVSTFTLDTDHNETVATRMLTVRE